MIYKKTTSIIIVTFAMALSTLSIYGEEKLKYPIVDTGQERCYEDMNEIRYPGINEDYFGQDAQYLGNSPNYKDNGNGTITDLVTGLMWQKNPGIKKTFKEAVKGASKCRAGGYKDWRLPTIKELYSLIIFSGMDPDPRNTNTSGLKPFINTRYFDFKYGDPKSTGRSERIIDSQYATCTKYVSTTMRNDETMFGVNFADGRIKGYPIKDPRGRGYKKFYVMYVRGNKNYGKNDFKDNKDGTVTDKATGLIWMKNDSRKGLNWKDALNYAEHLELGGKSDWRLPTAKELQSIVDYSRSPATTKSAAIKNIFNVSIIKEGEKKDFPYYWTSTTHKRDSKGSAAAYISFGTGFGWMQDHRTGSYKLTDVHGAGCQRSDPKAGNPSKFPNGRGPQGDVLRINNYVRCVRGGTAVLLTKGPELGKQTRWKSRKGSEKREGGSSNLFLRRLDKNSDGKVSKTEFDGPGEHFDHLDKNGDGFLNENEAPNGPPPGRKRRH